MKKMNAEVIEQATKHILETEDKILDDLFQWVQDAEHRAETCRCPNCQKEAFSAEQRFQDEVFRVAPIRDVGNRPNR